MDKKRTLRLSAFTILPEPPSLADRKCEYSSSEESRKWVQALFFFMASVTGSSLGSVFKPVCWKAWRSWALAEKVSRTSNLCIVFAHMSQIFYALFKHNPKTRKAQPHSTAYEFSKFLFCDYEDAPYLFHFCELLERNLFVVALEFFAVSTQALIFIVPGSLCRSLF